jgi:hypothetical protein
MISVAPDLQFLPTMPRAIGFLFGPSLCLFMVWLHRGRWNNVLYFLFGRSHQNHIYHCRNPSPYHPSCYGSTSSFVFPFRSFAWPRLIHSPARHTLGTPTGQAKAQIWAPMSSTWQILSSMVTCSYFPRVTRITYDRQLLYASKEDEATLVSYLYNSQHCQSQLGICVLLIPHQQH